MTRSFSGSALYRTETGHAVPDRAISQMSPCSLVRLNTLPGDRRRAERKSLGFVDGSYPSRVRGSNRGRSRVPREVHINRVGRAVRESATFLTCTSGVLRKEKSDAATWGKTRPAEYAGSRPLQQSSKYVIERWRRPVLWQAASMFCCCANAGIPGVTGGESAATLARKALARMRRVVGRRTR